MYHCSRCGKESEFIGGWWRVAIRPESQEPDQDLLLCGPCLGKLKALLSTNYA